MKARNAVTLVVAVALCVSSARAATFFVPPDEWVARRADAIVIGTIESSRATTGERGRIETIYTLRVQEALKGLEPGVEVVDLREIGGSLDGAMLHVSGTPVYREGARYLVFMRRTGDTWTTFDRAVGKFTFRSSPSGEAILVRDEVLSDARTSARGRGEQEQARVAREFIPRIREFVRQGALHTEMLRFATGDESLESSTPGDVRHAAEIAAAAWSSNPSYAIEYAVSPEPATGDATGDDGESRIVVGDPAGLIPGTFGIDSSVLAVAVYGCRAGECLPDDHWIGDRQFANITWSDVVLNDLAPGVTLSQAIMNTIVAHEMGHTLGFRHSNRAKNDPDPGDASYLCAPPLPCSDQAVMNSSAADERNGQLTAWDQDAAGEVYGEGGTPHEPAEYVDDLYVGGSGGWYPARRRDTKVVWRVAGPACQAPSITWQESAVEVEPGSRAVLRVDVAGTASDLEWYEGPSGDRSRPAGTGNPFTTAELSATTSFWVLASGPCGEASSGTITVKVVPACPSDAFCALSNRFAVRLRAVDHRTNRAGGGEPRAHNDLFGSFSIPSLTGDAENPEVLVKVLDGRAVNGNFWVFFGGLTDLEYTLTVSDSETGLTTSYRKPAGSATGGFDVGDGYSPESCAGERDGTSLPVMIPSACGDDPGRLCLEAGAFSVELHARDQRSKAEGRGVAMPQNDISGYFSLPSLTGDEGNPEVFVKVLDGRGVNGYFWLFYSGLTDLEYTVTVTDHRTGERKQYVKPAGSKCGGFDTNAF
jgi:hypothetical protein